MIGDVVGPLRDRQAVRLECPYYRGTYAWNYHVIPDGEGFFAIEQEDEMLIEWHPRWVAQWQARTR